MAVCTILSILDLSPADAAVGEVMDGKFFFAVEEPIKEGTMPTVAIAPGSSAYPTGYHVGDGGGLPAIDADLVTANIKNGITIFNILGDVDVRDISDADALVGEVKTGSTFYAVGGARKTGSGTQTLNPANENVPAGYYAATTLSAVDGDLAVGNIAAGVTIFGFLGTFVPTLAAEAQSGTKCVYTPDSYSDSGFYADESVPGTTEIVLITKTDAFTAGSKAVAGACNCFQSAGDKLKARLYMAGVMVAESGIITGTLEITVLGDRSLVGSQDVELRIYNTAAPSLSIRWSSWFNDTTRMNCSLVVGSVKMT